MKLVASLKSSTLTCSHAELAALLAFVADDAARINIRCILIDAKDRAVVSCDGHRMLVAEVAKWPNEVGQDPVDSRVLVPPDLIKQALKAADSSAEIAITWTQKKDSAPEIAIDIGNMKISGKGTLASFPPWRAMMQAGTNVLAVAVNPDYIAEALRRVLGKRVAVEIWLGDSPDTGHGDAGSVTVIQGFDAEANDSRWRYCVMPMKMGERPREPWEKSLKVTHAERAAPQGSPHEQPDDVAPTKASKPAKPRAPAKSPKQPKKGTGKKASKAKKKSARRGSR